MNPVKATILDDDKFRLLAIPFGGPLPWPGATKGTDLDRQWFTERTDIKPAWFPSRPVDWHHGGDATFGRSIIGKADSLVMEEDGWWVDVWLKHGEKRLDLIRRLADRGAQIFGSSETAPGMGMVQTTKGIVPWRRDLPGEIVVWPYMRQTLSTSPQNTHSIIRPLKAQLDDLVSEGMAPSAAFWSDIEAAVQNLGADLRATSQGEYEAKAGRVLRAENEADLRAALAALEEATERFRGVLSRQPDYSG